MGCAVILFGMGILLNSIFRINIPFFKIFIGIFVIYLGISIILPNRVSRRYVSENSAVFNDYSFQSGLVEREYNIVFSKGVIDFTALDFSKYNGERIEVNSIFSSTEIYISKDYQYEINASSAFGSVRMPGGNNVSFGSMSKVENTENGELKKINMEVNAVFGAARISYK